MIYCDTHVHCYQTQELAALLTYADFNFQRQIKKTQEYSHKVLFFTNSSQDKSWSFICNLADTKASTTNTQWQFSWYDNTLVQARSANQTLILAPAVQLNTTERLEFLLLGCDQAITDQVLNAKQIIRQYSNDYALICPWGVGKWLGQRGQIVNQLIDDFSDAFQLGDNGGRPWLWFYVPQFIKARKKNMSIINGSDPLPIKGEIKRTASFGIKFSLLDNNNTSNTSEKPDDKLSLTKLLDALKNPAIEKQNYGRKLGLIEFIIKRIALARNT